VLLKTANDTYLFQERDHHTKWHPGRIAPFGGGVEGTESLRACAGRELLEELGLRVEESSLKDIGLFPSQKDPDASIRMYVIEGVNLAGLVLTEGKAIVELSLEEALNNDLVTDFTKEVLRSL